MELKVQPLKINFSETSKSRALRIDNNFHRFNKTRLKKLIKKIGIERCKLKEIIYNISNGKDVSKNDYSPIETEYFYITVNNIKPYGFDLSEKIFLEDEKGEDLKKYKLTIGDLIVTRSGTVGVCKYFDLDDERIYIPSGYLMVLKYNDNKFNGKFLQYLLNSEFYNNYSWSISSGKTQKNLSQELLTNVILPKIPVNLQNEIVENLEANHVRKIKESESRLKTTQDIIDNVFVKYNLKKAFSPSFFEVLISEFSKINNQVFLRCGAQYRAFWDKHKGLLFEGTNKEIPIVRLSDLMGLMNTKTLKKGVLDDEYILIELEDIEAGTGRIINEDKLVSEIGSDKVCFEDCDLVTSKMRPYLGYTILNDPDKNYIGTTELLPFKINKDKARPEYLKYLLLSHEYLKKSELLMYGKEHPRIHPLDLLNIKVPCPDLDIQDKIIEEVKAQEDTNNELRKQIEKLRKEIDNIIWEAIINEEATKL